jgi:hypothetical protein
MLHDRVSAPDFATELARATPRLAPRLEVQVTHVVQEGSLAPAEYIFVANRPFTKRVRMDGWAIGLFMRFDGQTTVTHIYEMARAESELPAGFGLSDFILLVTRSLEAGYLVLSDNDCPVSWAT